MDKILDKELTTKNLFISTIVATCWFLILVVNNYPFEEWIGAAIVGFLSWYVAVLVVNGTADSLLTRVYEYAKSIDTSSNDEARHVQVVGRKIERIASTMVLLYLYGKVATTVGLMFLLASTLLNAFGFPSAENISEYSYPALCVGVFALASVLGVPLALLKLRRNRSVIRHRFSRMRDLVWSGIQSRKNSLVYSAFNLSL